MKCKKHPRYRVKRKPTGKCNTCKAIWNANQAVATLRPMYKIDSNGLSVGTAIYDPEGKKMGKIIKAIWEADIDKVMTTLVLTIAGASIEAEASKVTIKRKIKRTFPTS